MTAISFLGDIPHFLTRVFSSLEKDGIDISDCELDHVCYRVETQDRYHYFKKQLEQLGELLSETEIGGRAIATYKLHSPIIFAKRAIYCVELPSPKEGSHYPEGLEHIEFVIDTGFQEFIDLHPGVAFDTNAANKSINPDIKRCYGSFSVKFHHHSLEYVIKHLE